MRRGAKARVASEGALSQQAGLGGEAAAPAGWSPSSDAGGEELTWGRVIQARGERVPEQHQVSIMAPRWDVLLHAAAQPGARAAPTMWRRSSSGEPEAGAAAQAAAVAAMRHCIR